VSDVSPDVLAKQEAEAYARQGQLFRPLAASAIDPDSSPPIPTGLEDVDRVLGGGFRRGLHLLVGYSHNGKTQVLLRTIWENRTEPIVLFTPDEDIESVIHKLLSIATNTTIDDVFYWPASKKAGLILEHFPRLTVDENIKSSYDMLQLIAEAEQVYQQKIRFAAFDYLELFGSNRGQDAVGAIKTKSAQMKGLSKDTQIPWIVLHQLNRGGSKGRPIQMTDLALGGEQAATSIVGCWRQIFDQQLLDSKRRWEETHPTIHVSVIKNKQRPALSPDGTQYAIETTSGLIRPLGPSDRLMTGMRDLA